MEPELHLGDHWRRWLPRRLSSQLLAFFGVAVTLAAVLSGLYFTYSTVRYARGEAEVEVRFLARSIAAASANHIITRDLSALEELLLFNASFPMIESILLVDTHGRPLSEVFKVGARVSPRYASPPQLPRRAGEPLNAASGRPAAGGALAGLFSAKELLELWHPVQAGTSLGAVRIRYSLQKLDDVMWAQWKGALVAALASVLGVLGVLALLLRAPMRALRDTTAFAHELPETLGKALPVYQGTEEISTLSSALNKLSQQLLRQDRALAGQMAHIQSILDNLVDGVITMDAAGRVRTVNVAAIAIFGRQDSAMAGLEFAALIPGAFPTDIDRLVGTVRELEGRRSDGTPFPADLALSRSFHVNDAVYVAIVRDVTERQRLGRLKSEFVSTVSHELRTPLTSIHGALKLLASGAVGQMPPGASKLLSVGERNSQRLIVLINDLLDMEKLAAGKMAMAMAPLDLLATVEQSLSDNTAYADAHRVRFALAPHPARATVMADGGRLAQVLANLLSNAAKFSREQGVVEIQVSVADGLARVAVTDQGQGIPLDFQSEIFSAFSQAYNGNTRKQGGTGLGLKISKALVEAMRGEIGFSSTEGKGATFWFALPVVEHR